jgi:hypothetical protein
MEARFRQFVEVYNLDDVCRAEVWMESISVAPGNPDLVRASIPKQQAQPVTARLAASYL